MSTKTNSSRWKKCTYCLLWREDSYVGKPKPDGTCPARRTRHADRLVGGIGRETLRPFCRVGAVAGRRILVFRAGVIALGFRLTPPRGRTCVYSSCLDYPYRLKGMLRSACSF